jgi:leucyl-tRNA synthetase
MIQVDGKKMSKTKGNFVTWRAALDKYGPDAFRLALALAADGMDDANWRSRSAEDAKMRIESIVPFARKSVQESKERDANRLDSWLLSTVHRRVSSMNEALDQMKMRKAASIAFLEIWNDIRWYMRRSSEPRRQTLQDVFTAWVRLMAPFTPFAAEELNKELGGKGLVSQADWPSLDDFPIDESAELSEQVVNHVMEDARNVLKVVKGQRKTLNIYVASADATQYFVDLCRAKKTGTGNVGQIAKKFSSLKIPPERVFRLQYEAGEEFVDRFLNQPKFSEFETLRDASPFISSELGIEVSVQRNGEPGFKDPGGKAGGALPLKPAFYIE